MENSFEPWPCIVAGLRRRMPGATHVAIDGWEWPLSRARKLPGLLHDCKVSDVHLAPDGNELTIRYSNPEGLAGSYRLTTDRRPETKLKPRVRLHIALPTAPKAATVIPINRARLIAALEEMLRTA